MAETTKKENNKISKEAITEFQNSVRNAHGMTAHQRAVENQQNYIQSQTVKRQNTKGATPSSKVQRVVDPTQVKLAQQAVAQNQAQNQYLLAIEARLRSIEKRIALENTETKRVRVEEKTKKRTTAHKDYIEQKVRRISKDVDKNIKAEVPNQGIFSSVKEKGVAGAKKTKEIATIANFLKYGALLAFLGRDTILGGQKDRQNGGMGIMGAFKGFLGGKGEGGVNNAIEKAFQMGAIGGMLKGPIGFLVGSIVGAISGYIGSDDLGESIKKTVVEAGEGVVGKIRNDAAAKLVEYATDITDEIQWVIDGIKNVFDDISTSIKTFSRMVMSGAKKTLGDLMISASKLVPGKMGEQLAEKGASLKKEGEQDSDDAVKQDVESKKANAEAASDRAKKKKAKYDDAKRNLADFRERNSWTNRIMNAVGLKKNGGTGDSEANLQDAFDDAIGKVKETVTGKPATPTRLGRTEKIVEPVTQMARHKETPVDEPPEALQQVAQDNQPKAIPVKDMTPHIGKDLSVGEISGNDIKIAAGAANNIPPLNGKKVEGKVTPQEIASLVARESSGLLKNANKGDGKGITQLRQIALDDVKNFFGKEFSLDDVTKNPITAMIASGLYLRILKQRHGSDEKAYAAYNGRGPQAQSYSKDIQSKIKHFSERGFEEFDKAKEVMDSIIRPMIDIAPKKNNGEIIARGTEDVNDMKESVEKTGGGNVAVNAPNTTNVNNNKTVNVSQPRTRNDDPTLLRMAWGGFRG